MITAYPAANENETASLHMCVLPHSLLSLDSFQLRVRLVRRGVVGAERGLADM